MQLLDNPLNSLFILSFIVPLYCLLARKDHWLVAWIAFSAAIEIFNNLSFISLTSTKIAGIFLIPYAIRYIHRILQVTPGQIWLGLFGLLAVLGVIYGFLFPWPDYSEVRTLRQLPQGRTILYMGSYFLEMIVIVFLATKLHVERNFKYLIWGLIIGGVACTAGILIERTFELDTYYLFTGYDAREISYRSRGFNYEPRGAGYTAVIALLATLVVKTQLQYRILLLLAIYPAFYFSASISAAIILGVVCVIIFIAYLLYYSKFKHQMRSFLQGVVILIVVTVVSHTSLESIKNTVTASIMAIERAVLITSKPTIEERTTHKPTIEERTTQKDQDKLNSTAPSIWSTVAEEKARAYLGKELTDINYPSKYAFLSKFEIFDAAALNFFIEHPEHLIFGAGPGLIGLAASEHKKVDSLPHIGILKQISDYGLIGFGLWAMMLIIFTSKLLSNACNNPNENQNIVRLSLFAVLMLCYGIQVKIFYIFAIGIGLSVFISDNLPVQEEAS